MSYPVMDYVPFDYESYLREILPLWERGLAGEVQPLKQRIQAATHFSLWPHINCPLMIETEMMERLFGNDLEPLRERYRAYQSNTASVTLWNILLPLLDPLEAGSDPAHIPGLDLLHSCLLYTFCCDLPSEEGEAWQIAYSGMTTDPWGGTIVLGNEDVPLWLEYIERNVETRRLWKPFNSPPPPELIGSPPKSGQVQCGDETSGVSSFAWVGLHDDAELVLRKGKDLSIQFWIAPSWDM